MRGILVMFLLAGAAVAGCLGGAGDDGNAVGGPVPLAFRDPVDMVCPADHPLYPAWRLAYAHCGAFGEPQLEVAGDGTVWYSAVCCIGQAPPIWVSRDNGTTFTPLPFGSGTGIARDAFGIEGDFAIDDAGNVYFFDISAATAYFSKYEADGSHVHTKPDVFPPLVDRPWVRAGAEDEVFILYNTGSSSRFYGSVDGGLTWDLAGGTEFPCGLMTLGQGGERHQLAATGCASSPTAWLSHDGGASWPQAVELPLPDGYGAYEPYAQPAGDAEGVFYVPVTHLVDGDDENTVVSVYRVHPDGTVAGPWQVTPPDGQAEKPWLVAGQPGVAAFAYYAADNVTRSNASDEAVWHLRVAYTLDGLAESPRWLIVDADADPVLHGAFGRNLGDLLELRQTPDGGLAVAYAKRGDDGVLVNRFVRTASGPDLGPTVFRNGPTV